MSSNTNTATITVRPIPPTTAVIVIEGDITAASEEALTAAHADASGLRATLVVLDFSGLNYMNSGGIGMLVTLLVRTQRQHQRLAAIGLSDHYRQIFSLTRLDEAITLYDTEQAAVAANG
jgi:anti-anti-sigma factor